MPDLNPLIPPMLETFSEKRKKGFVPRNWLLALLVVLDSVREADAIVADDDIYTYDYTLKRSRGDAIPALLEKYRLPVELGMSKEGVTVRGAPCLRFFRAINGGEALFDQPKPKRQSLVDDAVEVIRVELLKVIGQKPVHLPSIMFDQSGAFVAALLKETKNRSCGRVEQALVGAKLRLRHPKHDVPINPTFAGDDQTNRDSDYEVGRSRVIVSVSPKDNHFESAIALADAKYEVFLVVSQKALSSAKKRIAAKGYEHKVKVKSVGDYVAENMSEIASDRDILARDICLELAVEYNRRIAADYDSSLQVILPS